MKRQLAALLLTIFALSLTACGETAAESETRTVYAMDTVMNLTVYGENAAAALESAFTGLEMSLKQRVFQPGEGLTMDSVEDTIAAVGRMGRVGMKSTDVEILNIMLGH